MKRENVSLTSALHHVRSQKIHLLLASSGAMTPQTKQCSAPKSLTLKASLRLPCGIVGYTRRVRSRALTVRKMIYLSATTTEPGNKSTTPS
jgi:hypothetical protein